MKKHALWAIAVLTAACVTFGCSASMKPTGIEFRHLACVKDKAHPRAPYKIQWATGQGGKEVVTFTDKRGKAVSEAVVLKHSPLILGNADVKPTAKVVVEPRLATRVIMIEFTASGRRKFADFTRRNKGETLAVVLNGRILSAPVIREPILQGRAVINGSFSVKEAQQIADAINAGAAH